MSCTNEQTSHDIYKVIEKDTNKVNDFDYNFVPKLPFTNQHQSQASKVSGLIKGQEMYFHRVKFINLNIFISILAWRVWSVISRRFG